VGRGEKPQLFQNRCSPVLIIVCGGLALGSVLLTAVNTNSWGTNMAFAYFPPWLSIAFSKAGAIR